MYPPAHYQVFRYDPESCIVGFGPVQKSLTIPCTRVQAVNYGVEFIHNLHSKWSQENLYL